jgi:hypothetical protein
MLRFFIATILLWDAVAFRSSTTFPHSCSISHAFTRMQPRKSFLRSSVRSARDITYVRSTYNDDNKSSRTENESNAKKGTSSRDGGGILDALLWHRNSPLSKLQNFPRNRVQILTLLRVGLPSVLAGIVSTLVFPGLALSLASLWNDPGVFSVLSQDSSQFVQNFLTVSGLLFSILVGQTCEYICWLAGWFSERQLNFFCVFVQTISCTRNKKVFTMHYLMR